MQHLIRSIFIRGVLALALLATFAGSAFAAEARVWGSPARFYRELKIPELTAGQITSVGTPPAGFIYIYTKASDKKLYIKDSTGAETCLQGDGAEWASNSTDVIMATPDDDLLLDDGTTISFSDGDGAAGTADVIIGRAATGELYVSGAAVGPATVRMLEDSDNGANYISIKAPASIASNVVLTLPAETDTLAGIAATQTLTNKTLTSPVLVTPALGVATATSVAAAGLLTTSSPSAAFGYATGAGGAVTQITSKSTGVTMVPNPCNCGTITMHDASLAGDAEVTFTVTNSAVAAGDTVVVSVKSGASTGKYFAFVSAVGAGSFDITVSNVGSTAGEVVVINFAVIQSVTS